MNNKNNRNNKLGISINNNRNKIRINSPKYKKINNTKVDMTIAPNSHPYTISHNNNKKLTTTILRHKIIMNNNSI